MEILTGLWRRLDVPGHDACMLEAGDDGACLRGMAVFVHESEAARLHYEVTCDREWRALRGRVSGSIGAASVDYAFARDDHWSMNGVAVPGLEHCLDLDFGFTPATNILPLSRLALNVGDAADAPAAWFDVDTKTLNELPQRYTRRSETTYWYESPTANYAAELMMRPGGFTRVYPGLWESELK